MQIAKTITDIGTKSNPLVQRIMDRRREIDTSFANYVLNRSTFGASGRKPKPAIDSAGKLRPTNLDLLSYMVDLFHRRAHVALSAYENQLPWKAYSDERHVGGTKRFGRLMGLVSHREHLSFSIKIDDQSVLRTLPAQPTLGAERTYMMVDHAGNWSAGWYGFDWDKTPEELQFLQRRSLLVDGKVDFGDYVHHNRRQSIYGAPYLLAKLLWQRIEDEIAFYEGELKCMEKIGVSLPSDTVTRQRELIAVGASCTELRPTFKVQLHGLEFSGQYFGVQKTPTGYLKAKERVQFLRRELQPIVQFVVRADEVAFYRFGLEQGYVAPWVANCRWDLAGTTESADMQLGDNLVLSYQKGVKTKQLAA